MFLEKEPLKPLSFELKSFSDINNKYFPSLTIPLLTYSGTKQFSLFKICI